MFLLIILALLIVFLLFGKEVIAFIELFLQMIADAFLWAFEAVFRK